MSSTSADVLPRSARDGGFTLIELTAALALFAFLVVNVLVDREDSIALSADARTIQTVRYLAAMQMDKIRHDPAEYGDGEQGDFEELNTDWQNFDAFFWEVEIEEMVVVGESEDRSAGYLFEEDEDEEPPLNAKGEPLTPRTVRKVRLGVHFQPQDEERPDLSIVVHTYLPPEPEEEEGR